MRFLLIFLMLSSLEASLFWKAEEPGGFAASLQISGEKISFQEPIEIELSLTHPSGYTINQSNLRRNLLRNNSVPPTPFVLTQETAIAKEFETILRYTLEAQLPGNFTLTFYDIEFFPKNESINKKTIIFSPLFPLKILPQTLPSLLEEPAPFLDLSRNLPINMNHKNRQLVAISTKKEPERNLMIQKERTFPWGLLGAIFIAGIAYIWYRIQTMILNNKNNEINAHTKAMNSLEKLKGYESDLLFAELSNIVRFYIEERYQIHAPRKTTEEFLEMLPTAPLPKNFPKQELKEFLVLVERIKFAKENSTHEERERAWKSAFLFINS